MFGFSKNVTGCSAEVGAADGGNMVVGSPTEVEALEMIDWIISRGGSTIEVGVAGDMAG